MPLFELASALSGELAAAYQLADRLSELDAIHDLAEASNDLDALDKITVGIAADPFDSDEFTVGELEEQHFFAQVYAEPEEGYVAGLGPEAMGNPREGGVFRVFLRRKVRESEDRTDAYNFFWDRVSSIGTLLVAATEHDLIYPNNYRFKQVSRMIGPEFGSRRKEVGQGCFLFAVLTFSWGDIEQE